MSTISSSDKTTQQSITLYFCSLTAPSSVLGHDDGAPVGDGHSGVIGGGGGGVDEVVAGVCSFNLAGVMVVYGVHGVVVVVVHGVDVVDLADIDVIGVVNDASGCCVWLAAV